MTFKRLAFLFALLATPAFAQDYPTRPITLIVPFAPGGSTDVIARVVAQGMRAELGQTVVVENHAGAGGSLGTGMIARAAPDGYTIGMATASTVAINPAAYRNLPFDVLKDLAPITNIAAVPNIMSVHPSVAAKTMAEFIALAKAQPGKLAYGSSGNGSVSHLMGEQFKLATGTDIVHVPYRGIGPAMNDAIGGMIQVLYDNLPTSLPHVQAGKLRALAVSGEKRVAALPDVPTFTELGLKDLEWMAFFGLVAPANTPPAVITKLNAAAVKVIATPEVRRALELQQAIPVGNSPAQFRAEIERDLARMKRAVEAANIRVDN
ncbi:MAG: tripartite tricarboxylate transporter substrate binding protein BugE [Pseudolabrys sp.]|nr:tripartite tricarboxylate transporter substrate binding protein BugE [Pseudolabrys sp.]